MNLEGLIGAENFKLEFLMFEERDFESTAINLAVGNLIWELYNRFFLWTKSYPKVGNFLK
jgi:hypothetical protein